MSNEKVQPLYTENTILSPKLLWNKSKMRSRFEGSCLRQEDTAPFTPTNGVYLFNVDELDSWPRDLDTDFTLVGCLFGGVKLTKNAHPDKYLNSGYGIGFNTHGYYSLPGGSVVKMLLFLGLI